MTFLLQYWPIIAFFTTLLVGQWGTTLFLKKEVATIREIFKIELENINEKLSKQNGYINRNSNKLDDVEKELGKHVEKFHTKK